MMTTCPICGTRRVVFWPEHWVYKRGETYYCSENCMMVDQTKDMKLIRMIAHVRAQKGSKAKMARMKKDGTPAKKPGPRPKIETPEANQVPVVEMPAKNPEMLEVYALRSRVLKDGYYKKNRDGTGMYLYGLSVQQEQVGLGADNWKRLSEEIMIAMEQLGVKE